MGSKEGTDLILRAFLGECWRMGEMDPQVCLKSKNERHLRLQKRARPRQGKSHRLKSPPEVTGQRRCPVHHAFK